MAVLNLNDQQVIELIAQLSPTARTTALLRLLQNAAWDQMLDYGQQKLDVQLKTRDRDRTSMTSDQIDSEIERIADGR